MIYPRNCFMCNWEIVCPLIIKLSIQYISVRPNWVPWLLELLFFCCFMPGCATNENLILRPNVIIANMFFS